MQSFTSATQTHASVDMRFHHRAQPSQAGHVPRIATRTTRAYEPKLFRYRNPDFGATPGLKPRTI